MEPPPQPSTCAGPLLDARKGPASRGREGPFLLTRKHGGPPPTRPVGSLALDTSAARGCDCRAESPELEGEDEQEEDDGAGVWALGLRGPGQDPGRAPGPPPHALQAREDPAGDATNALTPAASTSPSARSPDPQLRQNGAHAWSKEADGARGHEVSRDFAKLYGLDADPERKLFLDDLFVFMQKRGTPISRIPIMAKQTLDLYLLYKLVTDKGGLVEIINRKIWREVTRGLNLPTSITSAAFTLRTQYMKYLYAYECERKALSSPAELQAAIDGNRREGRRPGCSAPLLNCLPAPTLPATPKACCPRLGSASPSASSTRVLAAALKTGDDHLAMPRTLTRPQMGPYTATLEQPPDKRLRLPREELRLSPALRCGLPGLAQPLPLRIHLNGRAEARTEPAALSLAPGGARSISMSLDIDGTTYTGVLFAQKPAARLLAPATSPRRCTSPPSRGAEPSADQSL